MQRWIGLERLREISSLHQFHGEVVMPTGLSNFVDGNDARVLELPHAAHFTSEPHHLIGALVLLEVLQVDFRARRDLIGASIDTHGSHLSFVKLVLAPAVFHRGGFVEV